MPTRILIADDDATIRLLLRRLLEIPLAVVGFGRRMWRLAGVIPGESRAL
jgi:hypothetical protein